MATAPPEPAADDAGRDLKPMSRGKSIGITLATFMVPAAFLMIIGAGVGWLFGLMIGFAIAFPLLWVLGVFGAGIRVVGHNRFELYERLGNFHTVKFGGMSWVNPVFDRMHYTETLLARSHPIYESEKEAEFDFLNGSAPVNAVVWYSIVNPVDVAARNYDKLMEQIARWVYRYDKPEQRVANIVDGELRPRLQSLTVNDAQTNGRDQCIIASQEAAPIVEKLGAYLAQPEGIIVKDIDLPENLQALREKEFEGQMNALAMKARYAGPTQAALLIKQTVEDAGGTLTIMEAHEIVNNNQFIEAIQQGANVTLLGSTVLDLVKSVTAKRS